MLSDNQKIKQIHDDKAVYRRFRNLSVDEKREVLERAESVKETARIIKEVVTKQPPLFI